MRVFALLLVTLLCLVSTALAQTLTPKQEAQTRTIKDAINAAWEYGEKSTITVDDDLLKAVQGYVITGHDEFFEKKSLYELRRAGLIEFFGKIAKLGRAKAAKPTLLFEPATLKDVPAGSPPELLDGSFIWKHEQRWLIRTVPAELENINLIGQDKWKIVGVALAK